MPGVYENVAALFCVPLHCTAFDCDGEVADVAIDDAQITYEIDGLTIIKQTPPWWWGEFYELAVTQRRPR
jgi:hypothetical protein